MEGEGGGNSDLLGTFLIFSTSPLLVGIYNIANIRCGPGEIIIIIKKRLWFIIYYHVGVSPSFIAGLIDDVFPANPSVPRPGVDS